MLAKLAKLAAYSKAPKKTFMVLHPWKALKFGAAFWIGRKLFKAAKKV